MVKKASMFVGLMACVMLTVGCTLSTFAQNVAFSTIQGVVADRVSTATLTFVNTVLGM